MRFGSEMTCLVRDVLRDILWARSVRHLGGEPAHMCVRRLAHRIGRRFEPQAKPRPPSWMRSFPVRVDKRNDRNLDDKKGLGESLPGPKVTRAAVRRSMPKTPGGSSRPGVRNPASPGW